jgi:hypothetical protein
MLKDNKYISREEKKNFTCSERNSPKAENHLTLTAALAMSLLLTLT